MSYREGAKTHNVSALDSRPDSLVHSEYTVSTLMTYYTSEKNACDPIQSQQTTVTQHGPLLVLHTDHTQPQCHRGFSELRHLSGTYHCSELNLRIRSLQHYEQRCRSLLGTWTDCTYKRKTVAKVLFQTTLKSADFDQVISKTKR